MLASVASQEGVTRVVSRLLVPALRPALVPFVLHGTAAHGVLAKVAQSCPACEYTGPYLHQQCGGINNI
eukprot:6785074-Pyramimonas_sp.AAC.2